MDNQEFQQNPQNMTPEIDLSAVQRMKIIFRRQAFRDHELSVTFGLIPEKKTEVHAKLTDFINFVNVKDGWIHKVEEVLDAETHEPCDIQITFGGTQAVIAGEFHNRVPSFMESCAWVQ
jgi:hypothetical protein